MLHGPAPRPPAPLSLNEFESRVAMPVGVRHDRVSIEGVVVIRVIATVVREREPLSLVAQRAREAGYDVTREAHAVVITARRAS